MTDWEKERLVGGVIGLVVFVLACGGIATFIKLVTDAHSPAQSTEVVEEPPCKTPTINY